MAFFSASKIFWRRSASTRRRRRCRRRRLFVRCCCRSCPAATVVINKGCSVVLFLSSCCNLFLQCLESRATDNPVIKSPLLDPKLVCISRHILGEKKAIDYRAKDENHDRSIYSSEMLQNFFLPFEIWMSKFPLKCFLAIGQCKTLSIIFNCFGRK